MPVDAVKIPQNVQIEDKVVGPLSLRQIIIMALGGGFSYMIYAMVQRSIGHVAIPLTIVIWIPAVVAAAFAVVNINDLSLLRICFLLLERTQKPGKRIWAPRSGISITIRTSSFKTEDAAKKSATVVHGPSAQEQIATLSSVVDNASGQPTDVSPTTSIDAAEMSFESPASAGPASVKPPVNPERIQVDPPALPTPALSAPAQTSTLSDLSVFRDVFPPSTQWPA